MKFVAVTAGPLSELEQAEERLRRMNRPAKRLKNVIEGIRSCCLIRFFRRNDRPEHRG